MTITRRQVLAMSTALPLAAGLGGAALWLRWWDRPAGAGHSVLSADEYEFVQAIAEAWMPPGGEPMLSGSEADLGRYADEVLASAPERECTQIKALLQALDDMTYPTHGSAFRALDLPARTDVLRGWLGSDQALLRSGVFAVMLLLSEGYTTHPRITPTIPGYRCGYGR